MSDLSTPSDLSTLCPHKQLEQLFNRQSFSLYCQFLLGLLLFQRFVLDLTSFKKGDTNNLIFHQCFQELLYDYPGFCSIFTDGSKVRTWWLCSCGSSSVLPITQASARLTDSCSVFFVQLHAILIALQHVHRSLEQNSLIISDSILLFKLFFPVILTTLL